MKDQAMFFSLKKMRVLIFRRNDISTLFPPSFKVEIIKVFGYRVGGKVRQGKGLVKGRTGKEKVIWG